MEIERQEPVDGYAEGEEPLVFYYNRTRRLENAPKNVQDYYKNGLNRPKGLFGFLFFRRGNKALFAAMLIAFLTVIFMSIFGPKKNETTLDGVDFKLSSISIDDEVHVRLDMKKASSKTNLDEISKKDFFMEFRGLDVDGTAIGYYKTATNLQKESIFLRTVFYDYDIIKVECNIYGDSGEALLYTAVEKR